MPATIAARAVSAGDHPRYLAIATIGAQ